MEMRKVYANALEELMEKDDRVCLLDADLPLFRLAGENIRGSIHPMGKLAPWRST